MSHPTSEPARGQRADQAPAPRGGLFSHTPAEVAEQHRPLVGDRVDWRATPFSAATPQPHQRRAGPSPAHRRQPAGRPVKDDLGTAGAT
jgi:hypothetical protein